MAKREKAAKPAKAPKPKAAKAPKPNGGKAHNTAAASDSRDADQIKQGFLHHRQIWNQITARQKVLDQQWKEVKAALKADGYKVIQMQIADDLAGSAKAEAKVHAAVLDRLQVADWTGHPMGKQLDLFTQPDRTPAVDIAATKGKQDYMEGKSAKPPYDPSTPQYASYMEAYGAAQTAALRKGIKPLDEEPSAPGWGASRDPGRPLDA